MMKLADWLYEHGETPRQLREQLGVTHRSTVHRLLTGERRPGKELCEKIEQLTGGEVTAESFDGQLPRCAGIEVLSDGVRRVVLPWSDRDGRLEAAHRQLMRERPEWDHPSPQQARALLVLAGRAGKIRGDVFLLDGQRTDLRRVVEAANRLLTERGLRPIHYPCAWPNRRQP